MDWNGNGDGDFFDSQMDYHVSSEQSDGTSAGSAGGGRKSSLGKLAYILICIILLSSIEQCIFEAEHPSFLVQLMGIPLGLFAYKLDKKFGKK
ncbi:MAG: hypothetical protein ACI3U1_00055 [Peptococcaceae bacterium]